METKKNNGFLIGIIVVLLLVVGGLVSYILFGGNGKEEEKVAANNTTPPVVQEEIKEEVKEEKVKGECPLTKFDSSYTLTEEDISEIIDSIDSLNIGFGKNSIDAKSLKISSVLENGYSMNVKFDTTPNTSGTFARVIRVNEKMKVLWAGSGTTVDLEKYESNILERICS